MKVLAIATLFPNRSQPVNALFVEHRIRAMARRFPVRVLCPIPWLPFAAYLPRYRHRRRIPLREVRDGVEVLYPRFLSLPRFLEPLDGLFLFLSCWWVARRLQHGYRFDRIDAHLAYPDGWGAILLGRLFRVPVSVTLRGHDVNDLPGDPARGRHVAWVLRHASVVFTVAEALRHAALGRGVASERVFTVTHGVDASCFVPTARDEARRTLGLDPDERVILSVGHLAERKGFHHIVRALPRVGRSNERVRLVIVGAAGEEDDFTARLWAEMREIGVTDRVTLTGAETHERLALWYSAADVVCLASEKEGRPNVVLESIACGTPVVATRVWGTPELLSEDWLGILVDSVDPPTLAAALRRALDTSWDRERIADRSASFSWDVGAERVERALEEMGVAR